MLSVVTVPTATGSAPRGTYVVPAFKLGHASGAWAVLNTFDFAEAEEMLRTGPARLAAAEDAYERGYLAGAINAARGVIAEGISAD